jgi:hypothetical protein
MTYEDQERGEGYGSRPDFGSRLIGQARRHPEALLLLVAGAALLAGVGRRAVRSDSLAQAARSTAGTVGGAARNAAAQARSAVGAVNAQATSSFSTLAESASSYARSIPSAGDMRRAVGPVQDAVSGLGTDHPWILGALAAAAGAAAGASLPGTDLENGLFGELKERVVQSGIKSASDQLARLREARDAAARKLKEDVQERGLTPEGLREIAEDVVEAARDGALGRKPNEDRPKESEPRDAARSNAGSEH